MATYTNPEMEKQYAINSIDDLDNEIIELIMEMLMYLEDKDGYIREFSIDDWFEHLDELGYSYRPELHTALCDLYRKTVNDYIKAGKIKSCAQCAN